VNGVWGTWQQNAPKKMDTKKFSLKILSVTHLNEIADIWIDSLPDNLKSMIGKKLVYKYIKEFFRSQKNLGYGIFNSKELIGFVFFASDKNITSRIILKNIFSIILSFFSLVIKLKFNKILNYFNVLIFLIFSKIKGRKINNSTELLIISLKRKYQNRGLGTFLLKYSIINNQNYFKKFEKILVMTLKKTPENIEFYKKSHFKINHSIYGRVFLVLIL
tara:strand:- start:44 stop:697 length:654 start_codon:yes stop_codon:yes gene_type:complete